MKSTSAQNTFL